MDVRASVARALVQIGTPEAIEAANSAVPALIQALQDQDAGVRVNAAYALGGIGEGAKDAIPALIQLLQDPEVGYRATEALGSIGSDAVPALIQLLQDENAEGDQRMPYLL